MKHDVVALLDASSTVYRLIGSLRLGRLSLGWTLSGACVDDFARRPRLRRIGLIICCPPGRSLVAWQCSNE
jgi:hypothetical protein